MVVLTVPGHGVAEAKPDACTVQLLFSHSDARIDEARRVVRQAADQFLGLIGGNGSVTAEEKSYEEHSGLNELLEWESNVNLFLTVTVTDLQYLPMAASAVEATGVPRVQGLTFMVSAEGELKAQSRAAAVQDALTAARTYGATLGLSQVQLRALYEQEGYGLALMAQAEDLSFQRVPEAVRIETRVELKVKLAP